MATILTRLSKPNFTKLSNAAFSCLLRVKIASVEVDLFNVRQEGSRVVVESPDGSKKAMAYFNIHEIIIVEINVDTRSYSFKYEEKLTPVNLR